jgi:serpin B
LYHYYWEKVKEHEMRMQKLLLFPVESILRQGSLNKTRRMNVKNRLLIFLEIVLFLTILPITASLQEKSGTGDIASGNNAFALDLYVKLSNNTGNVFFSPYSISTALAMTYAGARGETEKQMAHAMHFNLDQKSFHPAFGEMQARINEIRKKGSVQLSVANSLWMQKDYKFLQGFLDLTGKNYDAAFNYEDFKSSAEKARADINGWVERKTNDKIKDLIKPGLLGSMTRLVLANAIYFKGSWETKFDSQSTTDTRFFVSEKDTVMVRMMNKPVHDFRYGENEMVQCLELPYADRDLSMIVLLPKKSDLRAFEKSLRPNSLDSLLSVMREKKVLVFLPKFKTTQELILNDALLALGMTDAFSDVADFSGMTGRKDLAVSAVIHKAFVDVNEQGTEAAAATAVAMRATAMREPPQPAIFRADHPFLFLIRENATGSILFMGRIVNPLK